MRNETGRECEASESGHLREAAMHAQACAPVIDRAVALSLATLPIAKGGLCERRDLRGGTR